MPSVHNGGQPTFRLANSQSALLSVSMPFGSMSAQAPANQSRAAQAFRLYTQRRILSAYALCGECRLLGFSFRRLGVE